MPFKATSRSYTVNNSNSEKEEPKMEPQNDNSFHVIHVVPSGDFTTSDFIITEKEMEETAHRIAKSTENNRRIMANSMAAAERLWSD